MFKNFVQMVSTRKQPKAVACMTKTSPKTRLDYEKICRALFKELQDLEVKAGIAEKADNARSGPRLPLHYDSDAPFLSARWKAEDEEERQDKQDYIRRAIRSLYFSVPDLDLRKQLIQKERELTDNERYTFLTDVPTAQAELNQAKAGADPPLYRCRSPSRGLRPAIQEYFLAARR